MFTIRYSNRSKKFLKKADTVLVKRIAEKIDKLGEDPLIPDKKQLKALKGYLEYELEITVYSMKLIIGTI